MMAPEAGQVGAASVSATQTIIRKYYYFGGQRVAMHTKNVGTSAEEFLYLHWDHLGSTVMETRWNSEVKYDQRYYAFGAQRDSGPLATDHRFTGQKLDGSGLYYYNARYYDPEIGHFISPDTLVPDPLRVDSYNRYMYVLGNPLNLVDPSGHCATLENGDPDVFGDTTCWNGAGTIAYMWDETDYWQKRFGDISVWTDHIAPSGVDAEFMANELNMFYSSEAGQEWLKPKSYPEPSTPVDIGDYTRMSASFMVYEFALTRDDLGSWYIGVSLGLHLLSAGIERGNILINTSGTPNPSYLDLVDIDNLDIQPDDKSAMMQSALAGKSKGGSVSVPIGFAGSEGQEPPYHATHGATLAFPGVSYGFWSRSWIIWEE